MGIPCKENDLGKKMKNARLVVSIPTGTKRQAEATIGSILTLCESSNDGYQSFYVAGNLTASEVVRKLGRMGVAPKEVYFEVVDRRL